MNILFVTPSPPSRLHRIRAYNLIKTLSRNHRVFLVTLCHTRSPVIPAEITAACKGVEIIYKSKLRAVFDCLFALVGFTLRPLEVIYCSSPTMEKKVAELCQQHSIDLVYIKRLRSAQYTRLVYIPTVLDTTDAMSLFYRRLTVSAPWYKKVFYYSEYLKHVHYERGASGVHTTWAVCSLSDITYLKSILKSNSKLFLVPNGVDTEYFIPQPVSKDRNCILVSGIMDKTVNIEAVLYFTKKIFPLILSVLPNTTLSIIGPRPVRKIRSLASQHVYVMGEVPDIRSVLLKSTIVVCPVLTGTGTRNKILQAWATGRPVVSTSQGAEGLEIIPNKNIIIADTPEDFSVAVVKILRDSQLSYNLVRSGLNTIKTHYSIDNIAVSLVPPLESSHF